MIHLLLFLFIAFNLINSQDWYRVDKNHSTIGFSIAVAGFGKVTGKFTESLIYIQFDKSKLVPLAVEAKIDVNTINTGIEGRDNDLRSDNFFDSEKHPNIIFISEKIEKRTEQWIAIGHLTMKGIKKRIELPFQLLAEKDGDSDKFTLGLRVRTKLNRLDYQVGNNWVHSVVPNFLANEINVEFDLSAWRTKKKKDIN